MITFSIEVERPNVTVRGAGTLGSGITTLMGPSGSGKSTIIKSLAGLVRPSKGIIRCDEEVWMDSAARVWMKPQQRAVGYMPQGNIVFPHMTVEENIRYSKKGDPSLLEYLLQRLGLLSYRSVKARELSGGEQQRVALGRALYAKPQVLLLDEPLTDLDWELRARLQEDIEALVMEWKIPCLWVTHNVEEAQQVGQVHWRCEQGQLMTE